MKRNIIHVISEIGYRGKGYPQISKEEGKREEASTVYQ
jgi:hypothetical protein